MTNNQASNQKQTEETFGFKWKKRDTYESPAVQKELRRWLFEKYFDNDPTLLDDLLSVKSGEKSILDAGCGSNETTDKSAYVPRLVFGRDDYRQRLGVCIPLDT